MTVEEREFLAGSSWLRALLQSPLGEIFSLDCNYRYMEFTEAHRETVRQIWGVEIEAGMDMLEVIRHPADRAKAREKFDRTLSGEILVEEEEYGDPLIGRFHFENRYGPIRMADGTIVGLTVCSVDISKRKSLEISLAASEDSHRKLYETMLQGVVYQDADGMIISMNPAAERILGKSREEFLGHTSIGVEHDSIREDGTPFPGLEHPSMVSLRTGQPVEKVVMGVWNPRLGAYRWINISAVPLCRSGEVRPSQVYTVFEDITEFKRLEDELRSVNRELEDRVEERTSKLQATVHQLQAEISKRRELETEILNISEREQSRIGRDLHEGLGQELAGLAFMADVMAKRLAAGQHPLSEAAGELPKGIRSAINMARRLARGLYPIELDRDGLLPALQELASRTQEHFGIACRLVSDNIPHVKKNAEIHIFRVVQECIVNAMKHGQVSRITIEVVEGEMGSQIVISDDGVGFDPKQKRTGMGLDIMEYRMREIGGAIRFENSPQGGTRIVCCIPG